MTYINPGTISTVLSGKQHTLISKTFTEGWFQVSFFALNQILHKRHMLWNLLKSLLIYTPLVCKASSVVYTLLDFLIFGYHFSSIDKKTSWFQDFTDLKIEHKLDRKMETPIFFLAFTSYVILGNGLAFLCLCFLIFKWR